MTRTTGWVSAVFRTATVLCVLHAASPLEAQPQQTTTGILEGAESWYLPTADGAGELFVFELGSADARVPTVVLHGGPGADFTYMLPVANGLEEQFRFVFYDQRGSLRSRVVPDSITLARHVQDLETLRAALEAEVVNVVSHSAGTLLALEYLEAHPVRVGRLVLLGALPHKNGGAYFDEEYARMWEGLAEAAEAFRERSAVAAELRRAGVDDPSTPKERAQAALIRQVGAESVRVDLWRRALPIRVNPEAARRTRESTVFEYDYGDLIASHRPGVTVVNGELDFTVGPRGSPLWKRLAATRAPGLQVVVIPDASHIVWRDAPDAFRNALRAALRR